MCDRMNTMLDVKYLYDIKTHIKYVTIIKQFILIRHIRTIKRIEHVFKRTLNSLKFLAN